MRIIEVSFGDKKFEVKNADDAISALSEWYCLEEGEADQESWESIKIRSELFAWEIFRSFDYFVFVAGDSGAYECQEIIGEELVLLLHGTIPTGREVYWGMIGGSCGMGFVSDMGE